MSLELLHRQPEKTSDDDEESEKRTRHRRTGQGCAPTGPLPEKTTGVIRSIIGFDDDEDVGGGLV